MDAAETARSHEADPDRATGSERAAHRRCADGALNESRSEIPRTDLARVGAEALELLPIDAHPEPAVENADGRGYRPGLAHAPLTLEPDCDAFAGRKAMRDERRLERDDCAPLGERVPDLLRDDDQVPHGIEPSLATQREAAFNASSGPPTR